MTNNTVKADLNVSSTFQTEETIIARVPIFRTANIVSNQTPRDSPFDEQNIHRG